MTKEQLLELCRWDEYDFANVTVYAPIFEQEIPFRFIPEFDSDRDLTDKMFTAFSEFMKLTSQDLTTVKDFLWLDCKEACEEIDYGHDSLDGESDAEANHREFNIHNREDAYNSANLACVTIEANTKYQNSYSAIDFEPPWEQEHGVSIIVKNGRLIAKYSNDVAYGIYESDAIAPDPGTPESDA